MTTKTTSMIVLGLIVIAAIAGLALWNQLPDQMASHWNANDEVDGTMPRFWGVFLLPLITLGMFVLFIFIPTIDPLKANVAEFRETFNLFIVFFVAFMLYIHALTLAWSLGYNNFKMSAAMLPMIGLLSGAFAIIGGFFGGMLAFWLMFVPLMGSTLFLVVYSYILYRNEMKT